MGEHMFEEGSSPGLLALERELYEEQPDQTLFHYTALDGMVGIISEQVLRASEVRYLNDSQELRYLERLISNAVRSAEGDSSEYSEVSRQFGRWLQERVEHGPMVFVASFSEKGNLLSQWRGYCPHGQGVSLGFEPYSLRRAANSKAFSLGKCVYDPAKHNDIVVKLLNTILREALERGPAPATTAHPSQSYHPFFNEIDRQVLRIAALLKHPSFSEEVEWRAVSMGVSNYVQPPIKYRVSRTMLVPYLELPLAVESKKVGLPYVVVGPTPTPGLSMSSISKFLAKYFPGEGPRMISDCQIPYRP